MAEFSYNNTKHLGTGFRPFMVVFGMEPLSPIDLALQGTSVKDGDEGEVVENKLFLEERRQIFELAKKTLRRAQKRYEKQVNKNRRQVSFKVGQKVWLNVKNFTLPQGLMPKFMAKFAGPFLVVKQECLMTPTSWRYLPRSKCIRCSTSRYSKSISKTR